MPRYKPIHCWEDLPPENDWQTRESYVLDFKGYVNPDEWWELGKDMAAFANSLGGVLLIGAEEEEEERPQRVKYHGLPQEKAIAIRKAYDKVHLEKLRPQPFVDSELIPVKQTERFIVAVNVAPFPDQPVGSMAYQLNKKGEEVTSHAWRFPYRVGRDTRFFSPEQLPMMINGAIRRTVLLLEGIPAAARKTIYLQFYFNAGPGTGPNVQQVRLDEVDVLRNIVRFTHADPNQSSVEFRIPLEDIEAVWEAAPGKWRVRVRGQLMLTGSRMEGYTSLPR